MKRTTMSFYFLWLLFVLLAAREPEAGFLAGCFSGLTTTANTDDVFTTTLLNFHHRRRAGSGKQSADQRQFSRPYTTSSRPNPPPPTPGYPCPLVPPLPGETSPLTKKLRH